MILPWCPRAATPADVVAEQREELLEVRVDLATRVVPEPSGGFAIHLCAY